MLSTSATGALRIGDLATALGVSQSTCSHHVDTLKKRWFRPGRQGRNRQHGLGQRSVLHRVAHAADVIMGALAARPCCPTDLPADVTTRRVNERDMDEVLTIYAEGLATRNATFETVVPSAEQMRARSLPELAWVAELDGNVVGWTAVTPTSSRACYSGVGETSVYVAESARGRGVGKTLLHTQVNEADAAGMWTLQTSIFPENRASLALHHSAGYRTLAVRSRIAQLDGQWRDTVLLERRNDLN